MGTTTSWGLSRFWKALVVLFALCLAVNLLMGVVNRRDVLPRAEPRHHHQSSVLRLLNSLDPLKATTPGAAQPVVKLTAGASRTVLQSSQHGKAAPHPQARGNHIQQMSEPPILQNRSLVEDLKNPHNFSYILNEPDACKVTPELVVVVCTSVGNQAERQAVRETWGNATLYQPKRVALVFLVGSTASKEVQSNLVRESQTHHDIVQEDFVDSYRNLSMKSMAMLRWVANFCSTAKYVLKSDDDMYINVPNLLKALQQPKRKKFILGCQFVGAVPVTNKKSKWYTPPELFNERVYPRYVSGTAYAMTTNCASDLFEASVRLPFFWLEDIFITGLCARKAGIPVINDGRFTYLKRSPTGCAFRSAVSGHRNSIVEIRKIHYELMSANLTCA